VITPGQAHDITAVTALMHDIDCDPEQMLGDKGYDSEAIRQDIAERGGQAVIPVSPVGRSNIPSTKRFMSCATASNVSSIVQRTHVGSPRDTTSSSKASPPSYCLPLSVSGLNLSTRGWQAMEPAVGTARPAGGGAARPAFKARPCRRRLPGLGERQGGAVARSSTSRSHNSIPPPGSSPAGKCSCEWSPRRCRVAAPYR
jgi:Transposase DDE domain